MALKVHGVCPLLEVFDMPTSISFYRYVLGFGVVKTSQPGNHFGWALLKLNDAELMLNTAYEDHDHRQSQTPIASLATLIPRASSVARTSMRLTYATYATRRRDVHACGHGAGKGLTSCWWRRTVTHFNNPSRTER
jgi:hypothetical protein